MLNSIKYLRIDFSNKNYPNFKKSNSLLRNINLLYIIYNSYNNFLKYDLRRIFLSIFPIRFSSRYILDFFNYEVISPSKTHFYCINKGLTYSISLKIKFKLFRLEFKSFNNNKYSFKKYIRDHILTIPNVPLITNNSTFIIDGVEKTIVSKFSRAPGLYFLKELKNKKKIFLLRVVPDIGNEIDFIIDFENVLYLRYNKNKILITDVLKVYGFNNNEILNFFYNLVDIFIEDNLLKIKFNSDIFLNYRFPYDIFDSNFNTILNKNEVLTSDILSTINLDYFFIDKNFLINKCLGCDVFLNGFKLFNICDIIDISVFSKIINCGIKKISIISCGSLNHSSVYLTLSKNLSYFDSLSNFNYFLKNIGYNIFDFNVLNINRFFKNKKYFDFSYTCRKKLNFYFKKNYNFDKLNFLDVINIIKLLISFKDGFFSETDPLDIANLNLSIVGDMLREIFLNFFLKLKKKIWNTFINFDSYFLNNFLNISDLIFSLKDFFSTSRYSQYLDQINSLSELSHKKKVTFLGVLGISKKYSGFNSRDLSSSHYSRICPIETPEGINIGLVNSLAFLCKVDKYNFLISPYYKVLNGKILKKWNYLSVDEEFNSFIAEPTSNFKNFDNIDCILSKYGDQLIFSNPKFINYINVVPYQMLSISTTLIPFLENNDSNRALMASNMLRQSLAPIFPCKPFVSTGFEDVVALNASDVIICKEKGNFFYSDSRTIVLKNYFNYMDFYYYNYDLYFLIKYFSSNQKTNRSQRLIFQNSNLSKIYPGDVLVDNSCTCDGTLSLGQNVIVAFMAWKGYNFEDSIIVSEKLVIDDKFSSLELNQIDISVCKIFDKFEFITKEISKNSYVEKSISPFGVIKNGFKVYGGDVIVGKALPISSIDDIDCNQRLLHSIFNSSDALNSEDTSFCLPYNFPCGTIVSSEVYFSNIFTLKKKDQDLLDYQINNILCNKKSRFLFLKNIIKNMLIDFLIGKLITLSDKNNFFVNFSYLENKSISEILNLKLSNFNHFLKFENLKKKVSFFLKIYDFLIIDLKKIFIKSLNSNVLKVVRILIISKRKLQVGDKMSGRYGNKGVVSKILPINEMPYMINGEIIDVILNPLGVPSRMNVGQLLEIHLGFVGFCLGWKLSNYLTLNNSFLKIKKLLLNIYNKIDVNSFNYKDILNVVCALKKGFYFMVSPFGNFNESYINNLLDLIFSENFLFDYGLSNNKKQIILYNGLDGNKFSNPVTIGYMYLFKLNHLSEDKIHSRSVGPYSLITQQPLKGKSNKGGQRLGEMEVWALEAYGAFYTLQEMFTIKSDDVSGRINAYRKIVKGIRDFSFDIPETFHVMMKNINSLSLYIRFNDY